LANDNRRLDGDWFNGSNFGYYELTGLKVASVKQFFLQRTDDDSDGDKATDVVEVEQGLTFHQTHYRSYRGRVFFRVK